MVWKVALFLDILWHVLLYLCWAILSQTKTDQYRFFNEIAVCRLNVSVCSFFLLRNVNPLVYVFPLNNCTKLSFKREKTWTIQEKLNFWNYWGPALTLNLIWLFFLNVDKDYMHGFTHCNNLRYGFTFLHTVMHRGTTVTEKPLTQCLYFCTTLVAYTPDSSLPLRSAS